MTNLTNKFDELESQLTTQHTALIAALDGLGAKLDAITTALGGAPPTQTISLADVVDAIQGTNTILGDVHLDTISMDQKLLRIRDAINPLDEVLPTEAKTSMPWLLFRLVDAMQPTWPRPTSVPAQPALDLLLKLAQMQLPQLTTIESDLTAISTVVGSPTDDTQSILRWLVDIAACACADNTGFPSPNTTPTGCNDPYVSSGMGLLPAGIIPGGASIVLAIFSAPLPDGVSFGTQFGLTTNYSELHRDSWEGWRVYVASDLAQFALNPLGLERYPTNRWIAMPPLGAPSQGSGNVAFSVADRGGLTVTLCPPNGIEPVCAMFSVPGNSTNIVIMTTGYTTITYTAGPAPGIGVYLFNDQTYTGENYNIMGVGTSVNFTHVGRVVLTAGEYIGTVQARVCCVDPGPSLTI